MSDPTFNQKTDDDTTLTGDQKPTETTSTDTGAVITINGRQYSTADLEKKITNADSHIATLEAERKRDQEIVTKLLDKAERVTKLEEIVQRMESGQQTQASSQDGDRPTVDADKIANDAAERAYERLNKEQQDKLFQENVTNVSAKLVEKFGDKADDEAFAKMAELGYSKQEAFELAGKRPQAFLNLVGVTQTKSGTNTPPPTSGGQKTGTTQAPQGSSKVNLSSYKTTRERVNAYEQMVQDKLKQLGIA